MRHSLLSPSSSHRWLVCPGSIQANRDKVHVDNFYSLEGTTAHGLLEVCLRLGVDPTHYIGKVLHHGHMPIDEAMADGVGYALDYVAAYLADNPEAHLYCEHEVNYSRQIMDEELDPDEELAFGTSDIIIDNYPKEVIALDYKHGVGIHVGIKDNSQLLLYLLGMRQQRGRYRRYRKVVVQPRIPKRKPVQEATVTDKDITGWANKVVRPVVPIALAKDAPRVAGEHCRYCKADGNCKAQFERVQEMAAKEFKSAAKDPKALTPAQTAQLLDVLGTLSQIAEAVKKRAIAAVHAGVKIPGYQQAWTHGRRIWRDEDEANELLEGLGLEKRERYSVELLSPPKAEDALKAKGLWPKKQRGVKEQMTPLDDVLAYTEGNPTIEKVRPEA